MSTKTKATGAVWDTENGGRGIKKWRFLCHNDTMVEPVGHQLGHPGGHHQLGVGHVKSPGENARQENGEGRESRTRTSENWPENKAGKIGRRKKIPKPHSFEQIIRLDKVRIGMSPRQGGPKKKNSVNLVQNQFNLLGERPKNGEKQKKKKKM